MVYIKYTIIKQLFFYATLKAVHFRVLGEAMSTLQCLEAECTKQGRASSFWGVTAVLELVLSWTAISAGTTSHQSHSAKLLSSATLISVHVWKQVSLKSSEQFGASFKRPGWVFHIIHKSGFTQNKPNDSSFMLSAFLGKERLHLGFLGPGLALNWEDAAHDIPVTSPGTQHPAIGTW